MLKLSHFLIFVGYLSFVSSTSLLAQQMYDYNSNTQFHSKGEAQISSDLRRSFLMDAARISMRMKEDLSNQAVPIPMEQVQLFYNLLVSIYEQDETARNIAQCNHIHTIPIPSVDYMEIVYNRQASWASPLKEGVASTNNTIINQLMEQYDLLIESHQQFNAQQDVIIIRAVEPVNMAALANKLYAVKEIASINLGTDRKTDTNIDIRPGADHWEVEFMLSFKEGQTLQQHSWIYYVHEDGKVEFITESGAPIPEYLSCR